MPRYVALLRGINIGPRNRISMAELRAALEEAGFGEVETYLQSGNVVLESRAKPESVRRQVEGVIAERFGLEIAVVLRTKAELAAKVVRELEEAAVPAERVVVAGREVYAWHPSGVARSKLWSKLAGKSLGVTATSRNWTTVEALLSLAGG